MRLEDFVKDLSINLNQNNWQAYKIQAASMLMDFDALSGEELAEIINTGLSYNDVLTKIFDNNIDALNKAVKKIMTETTYILHFVKDMYLNDKSSYAMLNDTSKNFLARPSMIHVADMSDELFDDWIGNPSSDLYTQYNTHNRLFEIINRSDKNLITKVVNHKNFKNLDFDRQKIIGNYIVDFYCPNLQIVIEIDGSSHIGKEKYDETRDIYLMSLGLKIIHIEDISVLNDLNQVIQHLYDHPFFAE